MKFEEAMNELESIAIKLESDNIDLETAIGLYERAVDLCAFCKSRLDDGNGKIKVLREKMSGLFEEENLEE